MHNYAMVGSIWILQAAYLFPWLFAAFFTAVDDATVLVLIGVNVAVLHLLLDDLLLFFSQFAVAIAIRLIF